jgi:hypothetical protein
MRQIWETFFLLFFFFFFLGVLEWWCRGGFSGSTPYGLPFSRALGLPGGAQINHLEFLLYFDLEMAFHLFVFWSFYFDCFLFVPLSI